jgi:hypothetical protein
LNGTANTGGGGAGQSNPSSDVFAGTGGSGVVIVSEAAVDQTLASSCWDLRQVYRQIKADDWV